MRLAGAALLAALLLAPDAAQAQRNQCGTLMSGAVTCANQAWASGIRYDAGGGWVDGVASAVTVTVTGGPMTTITSETSNVAGWAGGIVLRTAQQGSSDTTSRTIALTVGTGSNPVAIAQSTNSLTSAAGVDAGIVIHQRGARADSTTVTLGSGVAIGGNTAATAMKGAGIYVLVESDGNSGTHTITSAAKIWSSGYGLLMDSRGSGNTAVTNTGSIVNVAATGGVTGQADGIRVLDWSGRHGDDRTASTTTTVTNSGSISVSAANAHGIRVDADGLGLYRTVHSGTVSASGAGGHGIYVQANNHAGAAGTEAVKVESSGAITATGPGGHGILVESGAAADVGNGNVAVTTTGGRIAATGTGASGIHVVNASDSAIAIASAAAIEAAADGIHAAKHPDNRGAISIANTGAIETGRYGIVIWYGGPADVMIENSGAIAPASDASLTHTGIYVDEAGAGDVAIVNRVSVTGNQHGIFVRNTKGIGGTVTVTHGAGEVHGRTGEGISAHMGRWRDEDAADSPAPNGTATVRVEVTGGSVKASETHGRVALVAGNYEGGSIEVSVSRGATLTARHNAGIFAYMSDRQNTGGRIDIDQGGAITAEKGVYASVARASAAGETRPAAAQPLIDVGWTGTFTQVRGAARSSRNNVAHAIESAQEAQAGAVFRGAKHTAGIDAEVISWRILNRIATTGDDPGEIADAEAQAKLLDTASTDAAAKARAEAILTRFRAVLTADSLGTIPGAETIDTDNDDRYSNTELVTWLSVDDDARRSLLRSILSRSLSEKERAVLEAVAAGGDVDAALDDEDANFSDDYKTAVKALLNRYNVGDVRVAMTAGSIDSDGDGIRAWYGMPHDRNGSIEVTVAAGATVEGGVAGIYVANAGTGLRVQKKYASPAVQDENEGGGDDLVSLPDYLDQVVRVQGMVTGGSDAAVHLAGGGALIVTGTGRLVAGSSGLAVLVNDPGPAVIYIEGQVTGGKAASGGERARAAVETTGGGSITLGRTGRVVLAEGATDAIRADGEPGSTSFTLVVDGAVDRESADAAVARLGGGRIVGDAAPAMARFAALDEDGTTGMVTPAPIEEGVPNTEGIASGAMECGMASDDRCRLYEALPSMLLGMNGLPTYGERRAAARGETGGWARLETSRGEWQADTATRAAVAYDHDRSGVRAGLDVAIGEGALLGVSVHGLQGEAEMTRNGGKVELTGMGVGASATAVAGELYLDAQAQVTWFDVEVTSSQGRTLMKTGEVDGSGYALALEVGRPLAMSRNLWLTPQIGLAWSQVSLDGFTDSRDTQVSMEDTDSLTGRLGLTADVSTAGGLRLFGSLDAMEEFSRETEVNLPGARLEASSETTSFRLGIGGTHSWGEGRYALRGSATYTASGSDNTAVGGALSLSVAF